MAGTRTYLTKKVFLLVYKDIASKVEARARKMGYPLNNDRFKKSFWEIGNEESGTSLLTVLLKEELDKRKASYTGMKASNFSTGFLYNKYKELDVKDFVGIDRRNAIAILFLLGMADFGEYFEKKHANSELSDSALAVQENIEEYRKRGVRPGKKINEATLYVNSTLKSRVEEHISPNLWWLYLKTKHKKHRGKPEVEPNQLTRLLMKIGKYQEEFGRFSVTLAAPDSYRDYTGYINVCLQSASLVEASFASSSKSSMGRLFIQIPIVAQGSVFEVGFLGNNENGRVVSGKGLLVKIDPKNEGESSSIDILFDSEEMKEFVKIEHNRLVAEYIRLNPLAVTNAILVSTFENLKSVMDQDDYFPLG